MYDQQVWDIVRSISPSARGELEISAVNYVYVERRQLEYDVCVGKWTDAGTFPSLAEAHAILSANENRVRE
jgi:glucose-1-phosphate thymidylyltransferase